MKNIELKFRCKDFIHALKAVKILSAINKGVLKQTDIYFNIKPGRLKLRTINNAEHQLIYYKRANIKGSRVSNYFIEENYHLNRVENILESIYGIKAVVTKKRRLFIYKNCRIHLDEVKGLGKFIEFEVVCSNIIEEQNASRLMDFMKREFKVITNNIIKNSYSDLVIGLKG